MLVTGLVNNYYDIKDLFYGIDIDFNGENGLEHISAEAQEGGFESDLEYYLSECIFREFNLLDTIMCIYSALFDDENGYYKEHEMQVIENNVGVFVAISYSY